MKIWVIGRSYPEKSNGMAGSFELEQAKLLAKHGHEVNYLACVFHPFKKVKKWGACEWIEDAVHVYTYSRPYFPSRLRIYINGYQDKAWKTLLDWVEGNEGIPNIIHVHYPTLITQPPTILAYQAKGTKIVATEHWTAVQTGKINRHQRKQLKTYASGADQFICVGKPLKDSIQALTQATRELNIVPNVVPNFFTCRPKDWDDFRFVAVGRLVPVKQFDHLIKAFWQAFSGDAKVTLTIVGGGSEYKRLKKLIDGLGASNQIKLTGTLPRGDTAERISASDALICYSRLETFGVPVIEAWYCGLPVIASYAIGFAEYFDESLGLLIPYDDDNKLIESMKTMKNEYARYSKEYIHDFAEKNFSEAAVYRKLVRIYSE